MAPGLKPCFQLQLSTGWMTGVPQGLLTDGTHLPRAQAAAGAPSDRPWGQEPGLGQGRWESSWGQACWGTSCFCRRLRGSGARAACVCVCVCVCVCTHVLTHMYSDSVNCTNTDAKSFPLLPSPQTCSAPDFWENPVPCSSSCPSPPPALRVVSGSRHWG